MARVDTLGHFLTDVADAIREKTGSDALIEASDFDTEIANIPTGGGVELDDYFKINDVTSTNSTSSYWWQYKFSRQDIENVTITIATTESGMAGMFYNCKWTYLPKVATVRDYNGFNMNSAFYGCGNAEKIDLSGMTIKVTNFKQTFQNCTSLQFLDVRNIDFTIVASTSNAFTGVPTDCKIIVADATQKAWFAEKFPTLTNVKTVAEYEGG